MTRAPIRSQSGFTLIEVTLTMLILLVGLGGAVTMINGANAITVKTKQREAATNLQREVTEAARAVPYAQLTSNGLRAALQATPTLADSTPLTTAWTVQRRSSAYTLDATVCSVDDALDGLGDHSAGTFCGNQAAGTADAAADDFKRIVVEVSWGGGAAPVSSSRQTTIVTNPSNNAGPTIVSLERNPSDDVIATDVASITFDVTTNVTPASVRYMVDGTVAATDVPDGEDSVFDWAIASGDTYVVDGTYVISATALDSAGLSGPTRAMTVKLNRAAPLAPTGLVGGWNATRQAVDLVWSQNDESDVVGYRVYRRSEGGAAEQVCATGATVTTCHDDTHPEPFASFYDYYVVAMDETTTGSTREGAPSVELRVVPTTFRPNPPAQLSAAVVDGNNHLTWTDPLPLDEFYAGDGYMFFRIYRGGTAVENRFDHTGLGSDRMYTDTAAGGQSRQYWVTTVDESYSESEPVGPVTLP